MKLTQSETMEVLKSGMTEIETQEISTIKIITGINRHNQIVLFVWNGKQSKPYIKLAFRSKEAREQEKKGAIERAIAREQSKTAQKNKLAELKKVFNINNHLKVGDILVNTWGWEQTNVDFYQIMEIKGRTKLIVKELNQKAEYTGDMSGQTMPLKDNFSDRESRITSLMTKPSTHSITEPYRICEPEKYYYITKWDGKSEYFSKYA